MKKILISLGIILLITIMFWTIIFAININKCEKLEKPIFMEKILIRVVNANTGAHLCEYKGLGYYIKTEEKNENILESKMYLFGNLIKEKTN